MDVQQIRPQLWRWTVTHPEWTPEEGGSDGWEPEVGCYAHVARDALVLVDPLVPSDGTSEAERFWRALDGDVEHHGPPHVLITVFWHARSAQRILDRYEGARVWAHAPAAEEIGKRTRVTDTFSVGDGLPGGIEPFDAGAEDEIVYWLPAHRAVVTGDVLIAAPGGPIRVWSDQPDVRATLQPLLDLPVELVLLTHGEPLLENGRVALVRALET